MATKKKVEVDEYEGLRKKIMSAAPRGEDAGSWEISRTTDLVLSEVKYVLTSGIESFDGLAGGLPFGRMAELYGLESCGKTAMAIRCAARAMKKHICEVVHDDKGNTTFRQLADDECKVLVVYIDNEQSLDDDNKLTVDGEKLDVMGCRFDTTDDVFKAIDMAMAYQEERLEFEEADGIKRFMFIVVDTIASTSTKQELDQPWGKADFPRQPQQISRALRKLVRRVNKHNVAIMFTNQVRIKFSGGQPAQQQTFTIQANDYTSPGGYALRFYTTHRIFMHAFEQKYKLLPDVQFSAGLLIGFHTKKNRIKPPLRDGRMVLLFDKEQGGLNNTFSILETLVFLGFIDVGSEKRHIDYTLKFKANNIVPTTFEQSKVESTLEEDEIAPRRRGSRKDPGFKYRAQWPEFYTAHKADIDKLWEAAMAYAMATEGLNGGIQVTEEDDVPRHAHDED